MGVRFLTPSYTNQLFPVFRNEVVEKLKEIALFETWIEQEEYSAIRFVCSFASKEEDIYNFLINLREIL